MARIERKTYADPDMKWLEGGEYANGQIAGHGAVYNKVDRGNELIEGYAAKKYIADFKRDGFIAVGHDHQGLSVATISDAFEDDTGLFVVADFHSTAAAQDARTIAKERIARGKSVGLSIGYITHKQRFEGKVRHLIEIEPLETSLANIPMMPLAQVGGIKSLGVSPNIAIAPLDTDWDSAQADNRLRERFRQKAGRYTDSSALSDAINADTDEEQEELGYVWSYLPGAPYPQWGVFKLPIADLASDGSVRVIPQGVKEAATLVHTSWDSLGIPDSEKPKVKGILQSYFDRMRSEFGDDAPAPPWEQKEQGPLAGLTLDVHTDTVLAAVKEYADRLNGYYALRTKEGRKISASRAAQLMKLKERVGDFQSILDAILADTEKPETPEAVVNVSQEAMRFQKMLAQMNGVEIN